MIDIYEFKTFAEIDWEKERMIILECGHVFTMETMDPLMEMENYYDGDYKNWTDIKLLSSQTGENKIKTCPNCRGNFLSYFNRIFTILYKFYVYWSNNFLKKLLLEKLKDMDGQLKNEFLIHKTRSF